MDRRLLTAALAVVIALAMPGAAKAVQFGVQDDPLLVRLPTAFGGFGAAKLLPSKRVDTALDQLRADLVRINVPWANVAGAGPKDGLDLGLYDTAVDRMLAQGRDVQMTLAGPAPAWATGDRKVGAWRPSARAYARFVGAVARHFQGRVVRYSLWNEPNWWNLLRPRLEAARIYRRLYTRGRAAVKEADPRAGVLFGELAPLANPRASTAPLRFLRRITCSDRHWRATRACPPLVADGVALHPYTLQWAPEFEGRGREDVTMGSLRRLTHALHALARRGALATPKGRAPGLYLTEWGYQSHSRRIKEPQRSRYVRRGLRIAGRNRHVREVVWYQLAAPPPSLGVHWDSALLDFRGRPRPVFRAVRAWSRSRFRR
jgi:hypothetical protein